MDHYYANINKYKVLINFNVPLLSAPTRLVVNLIAGDEILAIQGCVYVKATNAFFDELKLDYHATYAQAAFQEEFVKMNDKIFELL